VQYSQRGRRSKKRDRTDGQWNEVTVVITKWSRQIEEEHRIIYTVSAKVRSGIIRTHSSTLL
jgi:hypothetical protein